MNKLNITRAVLSAIIVWTLGVSTFVLSYYINLMDDKEAQANLVLSLALIPITVFGAYFYYRKVSETNGVLLGSFMFLVAMILDAAVTVPVLMAPLGVDHLSFFGDPGFWIIGAEYVIVIMIYWKVRKLRLVKIEPVT